eukprot:TRINITY_DN7489_c0_g1_i16.p1 TRINITY_DN7489_c0_g1~~TRINITY_DN7489_c0_g1_i16.p1  ORF type:complete len:308 (-),score=56.43 TRINITY_DN7489_c0_g1_i16:157-1080(-)
MIKKDSGLCEDAYFLQDNAAGIADGVGGWSNYGITSSLFSKSLMKHCSSLVRRKAPFNSSAQDSILFASEDLSCSSEIFSANACAIDPSVVLSQAYERVSFIGSATALVAVLNGSELVCANIGDSKLLLIRFDDKGKPFVVLQSKIQQHIFNTPYQLANIPSPDEIKCGLLQRLVAPGEIEEILNEYERLEFCKDSPEEADMYQIKVQEGDLLLLGTDGVFDNLFLEEIMERIRSTVGGRIRSRVPPKDIANAVAESAYARSKNPHEKSPFSVELQSNGEPESIGGKEDDITVLVLWITQVSKCIFN